MPLIAGVFQFRQALGNILGNRLMVRCGAIHPPARATSSIFSSGNDGMVYAYLMPMWWLRFLGTINNMSEKRPFTTDELGKRMHANTTFS